MSVPSDPRSADERLARFADRLLAGEHPALDDDPELRDLQKTLQILHRVARPPEDATRQSRLHLALQAEWRRQQASRPSARRAIGFLRPALTVVTLIGLVAAALYLAGGGSLLPAAAGARSALAPLALGLILLLGLILFWIARRKD